MFAFVHCVSESLQKSEVQDSGKSTAPSTAASTNTAVSSTCWQNWLVCC